MSYLTNEMAISNRIHSNGMQSSGTLLHLAMWGWWESKGYYILVHKLTNEICPPTLAYINTESWCGSHQPNAAI